MYELTHNQAQKIVDKMMKDIPYNINIMDKRGIIIGSGNKERIGTLHKGAIEAIKQRGIVEIETDTQFEKRGINLPIEINDEIVGVVGISGEVKNTRPFGNLVKSTVILLIEQNVALERINREKNKKQEFFSLMLNPNTEYTKEILNQALTYNINLNKPTQIIYLEFPYAINDEMLIMDYFPSFKISNHSLCIVIQESNHFVSLEKHIESHYTDTFISINVLYLTNHVYNKCY